MSFSPVDYGTDDRIIRNLSSQNLCKQSYLRSRLLMAIGLDEFFVHSKEIIPPMSLPFRDTKLFQTSIHKLSSHPLFIIWKQNEVGMLITWAT